jgi:hypothetical protein
MRVMASPWGITFGVIVAVLTLLLEVSAIAALLALALFLVRRSRWTGPAAPGPPG